MDETTDSSVLLVARCLVAGLFLWSGIGQVSGYDETTIFMARNGVMSTLLPIAVFIELAGGILLVIGWQTRCAALALAIFCVVAALLFHTNFADRNQLLHFEKDLAIAGGLLALAAFGPGRFSLDGRGKS